MIRFISLGVLRDPNRSLFPVLICSAGVFLTFFGISFVQGFMTSFFDSTSWLSTGHVKIVSRAYAREISLKPLDLSLYTDDEFFKILSVTYPNYYWTRRIHFGSLLDIPDEYGETKAQAPVIIMALELGNPEIPVASKLGLTKSLISGHLPFNPGEILMPKKLADKMGVKLGDKATLFGSTMDGALSCTNYKVCGLIQFGIAAMDRATLIMTLQDSEKFLDMVNYSPEVLGIGKGGFDREESRKLRDHFNKNMANQFSITDEDYFPQMLTFEDQENFKDLLDINDKVGFILMGIFIFLMTLILWNTGLINGLRRYNEIGLRLALGERRNHIVGSMLMESLLTGFLGCLFGLLIALPVTYYFQVYGIDYSKQFENISLLMRSQLRAQMCSEAFLGSLIPGFFASFLGMFLSCLGIYSRETAHLIKELE